MKICFIFNFANIITSLELCLKCNNFIFNKKHFLQNDGTAQGPHISCSYNDIAIEQTDKKALAYILQLLVGKGFEMIFFLYGLILQKILIYFLTI